MIQIPSVGAIKSITPLSLSGQRAGGTRVTISGLLPDVGLNITLLGNGEHKSVEDSLERLDCVIYVEIHPTETLFHLSLVHMLSVAYCKTNESVFCHVARLHHKLFSDSSVNNQFSNKDTGVVIWDMF